MSHKKIIAVIADLRLPPVFESLVLDLKIEAGVAAATEMANMLENAEFQALYKNASGPEAMTEIANFIRATWTEKNMRDAAKLLEETHGQA